MSRNRLRLNPTKTELIWFGSSWNLCKCPSSPQLISGVLIKPSTKVRNLGVILESDLSMKAHVSKLLSVCFFHIRQLRLVRRSLNVESTHALVRALIHSRLDYCNSTLFGLSMELSKQLQSVMKAAARLIFRLPGHASVTDLINSKLHWLNFPQRVNYKLCVMAYKSIHGIAPMYLQRRCTPVASATGRSQLRSASSGQLMVARARKSFGEASFSYCGPMAWNSLPQELREQTLSLSAFKKQLKTFLYKKFP